VLDAAQMEGRHWNNDGVLEDVATGSAAWPRSSVTRSSARDYKAKQE
jgi:trans-2,3-dihydro-3-hydroxyanthranilate isomerase